MKCPFMHRLRGKNVGNQFTNFQNILQDMATSIYYLKILEAIWPSCDETLRLRVMKGLNKVLSAELVFEVFKTVYIVSKS